MDVCSYNVKGSVMGLQTGLHQLCKEINFEYCQSRGPLMGVDLKKVQCHPG